MGQRVVLLIWLSKLFSMSSCYSSLLRLLNCSTWLVAAPYISVLSSLPALFGKAWIQPSMITRIILLMRLFFFCWASITHRMYCNAWHANAREPPRLLSACELDPHLTSGALSERFGKFYILTTNKMEPFTVLCPHSHSTGIDQLSPASW